MDMKTAADMEGSSTWTGSGEELVIQIVDTTDPMPTTTTTGAGASCHWSTSKLDYLIFKHFPAETTAIAITGAAITMITTIGAMGMTI